MGGGSQVICQAGYRYGATWGPDDTIVFATADSPGLMRMPASGGEPQPLIKSEAGPQPHRWPEFLPGGKDVLFTIGESGLNRQVAILSLAAKTHHVLIDGMDAHFVPPGYLVFAREDSLWAIPFDIKHLEQTGRAAPIVEGVQVNMGGWAQYAVANDGTLAYLPSGLSSGPLNRLVWVDRQGTEEPIAAPPHSYFEPQISPDGTRLALTVTDSSGNGDIQIWDFERKNLMLLTPNAAIDNHPLWTLDSKRIVFFSSRENSMGIYWQDADGAGKVELLCSGQFIRNPSSWSDDGKTFVFSEGIANSNIGELSMGGDPTTKLLLYDKCRESSPQISPDGRWMAYASDEEGQYEVYVRPFPDVESDGKWKVSTHGGNAPLWSRDGREIFYLNGDAVMVASVIMDPSFDTVGTPQTLFQGRFIAPDPIRGTPWDIHPDGKRFLMMKPVEPTGKSNATGEPRKINIILNWFEELKERVPVP
jgi:hypothetical protein